jgi:4-hydroxybenzoate polyprenyltransferase
VKRPKRIKIVLEMIKFEHSVFALPFALTGALLGARATHHGWPTLRQLAWVVVAMVAARSAAMTVNRIVDLRYDRENPRTRQRALATGLLSVPFAWTFTLVAVAIFFLAAWQLNLLALKLAPLALAILFFYSFTKRFTTWSHLFLGFALGISPAAAWIAITGGFGVANALLIARIMHVCVVALLLWLAASFVLPWPAWLGIAVVAALLAYEHSLVKADDLSKLDAAFFAMNGYISMSFLLFWGAAVALWRV